MALDHVENLLAEYLLEFPERYNLLKFVTLVKNIIFLDFLQPILYALYATLFPCGHCLVYTIPFAVLQACLCLGILHIVIWISKFVYNLLQKTIPNVAGTLLAILTYQPILLVLFSTLCLQQPVQVAILRLLTDLQANPWWVAFLFLFSFKSFKIAIHTYSYVFLTAPCLYLPSLNPTYTPKDVTVIVPTVGDLDDEFKACTRSILANAPSKVIICTVGLPKLRLGRRVCKEIDATLPQELQGKLEVIAINEANKRAQFIHAVELVKTHITAYADDHVFWPTTFLKHALAPFEDPLVGLVGTVKRVLREREGKTYLQSLMNYIAVIYLERHNFECTATYNLDGGVFVISGRTALTKTEIVQSVEYRAGFLSETWWWGSVGPMKVDDDNFTTRFMVNHGYKTVFHNDAKALVRTTLGTAGGVEKFRGQLIRWVRTTWRSNPTSLFYERACWRAYPWTTFAMFITSFVNIALLYDPLLFMTLYLSGNFSSYSCRLLLFLVVSKTIKQVPHLLREPEDILGFWIPGMLFGYVHSLFKVWALFTSKNIEWTGRTGIGSAGGIRLKDIGRGGGRRQMLLGMPTPVVEKDEGELGL